jgi:DNA-binding LytR/AlgR family response regulator
MSKIQCIVIEDEPLATKILTDYIAQVPFLELQKTFKDAIFATEYLRQNQTDLIFLDIHLPKLKGMAFLKTLIKPPAVIITTAYHQYAVEGFSLNVTDYLLKPIEFERFLTAVTKVKMVGVKMEKAHEKAGERDYIFLNVEKKRVKILFAEIIYVESQREYIKIATPSKEYISKMGTGEIEKMLPANLFKRIHRSFIISLRRLESFTAESVEVSGISLPVGRGYRDVFEQL